MTLAEQHIIEVMSDWGLGLHQGRFGPAILIGTRPSGDANGRADVGIWRAEGMTLLEAIRLLEIALDHAREARAGGIAQ